MSTFAKVTLVVSFPLLGLLALGGCGAAAQQPSTITIGYVGPVTGQSAQLAESETAGSKLGVKEINKAGGVLGKQIELQVEDTGGTNEGAVAAVTKLIEGGKAVAIIGQLRSPNLLAAMENIQKGKIPSLSGATATDITHKGNPYVFRVRANDDTVTSIAVDFIVKNRKIDKVAILHDSDSFGIGGANGLKQALAKYKIEPVTIQTWTTGAKDYTAPWLNIQKSGAQAVFIWLADPQDGAMLLRQRNELGIKMTLLGSGGFTLDSTRKLAGDNIVGMFAVSDWSPELATSGAKDLQTRFKAEYGQEKDYLAMMSYDQLNLVVNAIKTSNSTDRDKIRDALAATKDFHGYMTDYSFDKYQDGVHQAVVVEIQKDTLKGIDVVKTDVPQ